MDGWMDGVTALRLTNVTDLGFVFTTNRRMKILVFLQYLFVAYNIAKFRETLVSCRGSLLDVGEFPTLTLTLTFLLFT